MVTIGVGSGFKVDAALPGGLGQRVGQQARGAAAPHGRHENALAVEVAGGRGLGGGAVAAGASVFTASAAAPSATLLASALPLEGVVELGGLLGVLGGELLLGRSRPPRRTSEAS